jgi:hypothetical protein
MNLWQEIKQLEGQTLHTLDHSNPFDILSVDRSKVTVRPHATDKERSVPWPQLENAFRELSVRGEISRVEIEHQHSPRNPAYVAAILAELPGVTHKTKPIRLFYWTR